MLIVRWGCPPSVGVGCVVADLGGDHLGLAILDFARAGSRPGLPFIQPMLLTATRPHLGGRRWWFECPHAVDGRPCGRRCRILYATGSGGWACRVCLGLTYRTRQEHRSWIERTTWVFREMDRLHGDLRSRSPRRKLRALARLVPELGIVLGRSRGLGVVKRAEAEGGAVG